jgi:hypothetical protein
MAAKGSLAKQEIANKVLETFPGSFLYNDGKEIRINWTEDGLPIQIKMVLTAAKVAVEGGEDVAIPGAATAATKPTETNEKIPQEPSEEEKERLAALLSKLGL